MIYLDNAATTRPCAEAVAAVNDALTARWGNPSAVHRLGIEAARLLRTARQDVAEAMGAETERVFFTSGGTEADNWAIFSAAERLGAAATSSRRPWSTTPCSIPCRSWSGRAFPSPICSRTRRAA